MYRVNRDTGLIWVYRVNRLISRLEGYVGSGRYRVYKAGTGLIKQVKVTWMVRQ